MAVDSKRLNEKGVKKLTGLPQSTLSGTLEKTKQLSINRFQPISNVRDMPADL